jgi:protein-S-isoprenylcysteine O-methyltransferase Ste14
MTRRKITLVVAPLCGAVAGALATLLVPKKAGTPDLAALSGNGWLSGDTALRGYWPFLVACAAGWVVFSFYWEIAAKGAAPAKSSESRASRGLHVFLANAALLVEIPVRGLGRFMPVFPLIMAAGVVVEAVGLCVAIWARRHLGRNWSGEITIKVEHQLIRSGPYRSLRHPIYTGLLAMYVGPALVTGEWLALIGVAMAAFAYWRKIRLEETALEAAFGADYDAYRRETWALVPGVF